MNTSSTIRLLAIFVLTLSMTAFAGSGHTTPSAHLVRADYLITNPAQNAGPVPGSADNQWVPSGPQVDKILITTYADEGSEINALKAGTIDEIDWTLSQSDAPTSCTPGSTAVACNPAFWVNQPQGPSAVASYSLFGIDFNHANTFFGINFGYNKDTNPDDAKAVNFRQGVAHLVDRVAAVQSQFGALANTMDNPTPAGQSFGHTGLPFDPATCPANGFAFPQNCIRPYTSDQVPLSQAGYSLSGVCGTGTGTTPQGWDVLDAQHRTTRLQTCQSAFKYGSDTVDSAGIVTASNTNPDFCDAADHWVAAGLATAVRTSDCSLAGFGTAALTGGKITFIVRRDNLPRFNIGNALANRLCELINGAGSSPTGCLQIAVSQLSIQETRPIVFATDIVHLDWHLYTFGWGIGPTPEQDWSLFNGQFAGRWCGGVPGPFGTDYIYNCNTAFDHYANLIEFNSTNAGAIASLQKTLEIFGRKTVHIDIYAQNDVFAYRKEWRGMTIGKGIGLPTGQPQINAWSPTPAVPGQLRWGFKQGTSNPNPLSFTTQWEFQWNTLVYDSLIAVNPYSPTDAFGWMVNQWQILPPQPGDPLGTASDVKFNLRNDIFFHDGVQVTASDYMFSWQGFANTGGLLNPNTAGIVGVKIQNDFNFIVNLSSSSVFALFNIGGFYIIPQHTLSAAPTTKCTDPATPACTIRLGSDTDDLVALGQFTGSGPFVCVDPATGRAGGKCSATGSGSVPFGSNIVLTRDGFGQAGTANSAYFRDSAKYKQFQWADVFSSGTVNILSVSNAASCLGKPVTGGQNPGCLHWDLPAAAISCAGATVGSCNASSMAGLGGNRGGTVTFIEIQQAFRWFGVTWNSPSSYASLSSTTGCGGTGCGAQAQATQTLYEGGITYGPAPTA